MAIDQSSTNLRSIPEALIYFARTTPDKACLVICQDERYRVISYRDLLELSQSLGFYFASRVGSNGAGPIFIILQHSIMLHASFLACMLLGRVPSYLPFPTVKQDPALYFSTHNELFKRVQPAAVITYGALVEPLREILPDSTVIVNIDDYTHTNYLSISAFSSEKSEIALLQHSSGTTGLKKGVQLTHAEIALQIETYRQTVDFNEHSIVASWLPLYHDMGLFTSFLMPIMCGSTIVSIDAFEWVKKPSLLLKIIELFHCTHSWLPNFAFNHILNTTPAEAKYDLSSVISLVNCSEPPKASTMRAFASRFVKSELGPEKLQACYAMAETAFAVSQAAIRHRNRILKLRETSLRTGALVLADNGSTEDVVELVSNGQPLNGLEVAIRNDKTGEIEVGESAGVGEVLVRGDFVFKGYFLNPAATSDAFVEGWYRTGDQGFISDRELYICGRLKELIIVHGRNYYVHDIEELVSALPHVVPGRVVAIGIANEETGSEEVLLLVEADIDCLPDKDIALRELKRSIKKTVFDRLELTIQSVEFVPKSWLVKTTSGKLSRSENLKRFREKANPAESIYGD